MHKILTGMAETQKILITGGAGFIGSHLALKLISKKYDVRVLDNLSQQIHGKPEESFLYQKIKGKVDFIHGDVRNSSDWEKALENVDSVVHLAAETGTGQSMYEINRYVDVNVGGTARMLDYIVNIPNQIKKIVVASSRAIYGEGKYICEAHGIFYPEGRTHQDLSAGFFECRCPVCEKPLQPLPTNEDSLIKPSSVYGITKYNQEALVMQAGKAKAIPVVGLRYQNVYGPGQSLSNPYTGILSIFSKLILGGQPINIFEDGLESRDFVYIDDVVAATLMAIESSNANFQVFNVGSGKRSSVQEIARMLYRAYDCPENFMVSGDFRLGDIRHNYACMDLIKNRLGYTPAVDIENGITAFAIWVKSQNISNEAEVFNSSLNEMADKHLFVRGKSKN